MNLLDKDKLVRRRNTVLCSVPGSGFHDKDPFSPQNQGLPPLRDHIVVFEGEFERTLVGDSAAKAHAAIKAYADTHPVNEAGEPHLRGLARAAAEYAAKPLKDGSLVIRGVQWNAIQEVLDVSGVAVTSTDDKPFPANDPILKALGE